MKNKPLSMVLTLGLALAMAGCDDEFLVTEPQDVISDAIYWRTERDFTLAINAVYREVLDTDQLYLDGATDLAYSQKDWTPVHPYAQGFQDGLTGWSAGIWARLYRGISRSNEVLNRLEANGAALSPAVRTQIEAQARFLRGYFYHELLWMYGPVPVFTEVPTVEEARSATRASREEVYTLIMEDLDAAAAGLPVSWAAADYGRATRGAALAYKARAALYEASHKKYAQNDAAAAAPLFQTAADAAQAVMNLNRYSLYPNFRNLFTSAGEGSAEVIFDYQHVRGVNGWAAFTWFGPHSQGANIDLQPTRELVDMFRMTDGLPITESPLYNPAPPVINGTNVVSLGMYANRDPRFYGTVLAPGLEFGGAVYNSFPESPTADKLINNNFSNTHTGYVWLKYTDPADRADPGNSGINIIKMRYADVLLMYAEAKIELNQIDASVKAAIDQVRARVGMPAITLAPQAQMIDLIRNERTVELALEGLRLADIRRWRIAHQVMPGTVGGIDVIQGGNKVTLRGLWQRVFNAQRDYLWPIPTTERDLNGALQQNPGY